MSDNTYKEIVDKLKKEQGFEILIDYRRRACSLQLEET